MLKHDIYFPIKSIPVIENRTYGYIVNFTDLEYINEIYGLSYADGISCILQENNINNCIVAIDEWKIFNNVNIINEINNDYITIPISKNNLMYRYVDYILEQSKYSDNCSLFLHEGLVEFKYFDEFVYNEGFKDNVQALGQGVKQLGSDIASDIRGAVNDVKNTGQQIKQVYNQELSNVSGNQPPSLNNRMQAGFNIAKNVGRGIQQKTQQTINNTKNNIQTQYNQQLNRLSGGESPTAITKGKAAGHVIGNYVSKAAGSIIDKTDKALTISNIDPNNPDIISTASDLLIPGSAQFAAQALKYRGKIKIGARLAQATASEKLAQTKAAINQKINEERTKLSSLTGEAKAACQRRIVELRQNLNNLMSKNN